MIPSEVRSAADHLFVMQRQAQTAIDKQAPDWQRALLATRRDLASEMAKLSAAARRHMPLGLDHPDHLALAKAINGLRHTIALHQAAWPVTAIDPASPAFQSSIRDVRSAYDVLFAALGRLDRSIALASTKEDLA